MGVEQTRMKVGEEDDGGFSSPGSMASTKYCVMTEEGGRCWSGGNIPIQLDLVP